MSGIRNTLKAIVPAAAVLALTSVTPGVAQAAHHKSVCQQTVTHPARCSKVLIRGHRAAEGPASGTNENTLWALRKDAKLGVGYETDTWRLAADDGTPNGGRMVILHDQTPNRVVDPASMPQGVTGRTKIGSITYAQFKQLRTKGGQPLPTLGQWVKQSCKLGVPGFVEIKYAPGNPQQIADWTNKCPNVAISYYGTPHTYKGVCTYTGTQSLYAVGMVVGIKMDNEDCQPDPKTISDMGYSYVVTGRNAADATYVAQAHALGLQVGNFDSESRVTWTNLVNAGADFIIAPHPGKLKTWLRG